MGPSVYSLTDLTGRRKNVGRTMIISGIEVGRQTLIVFSISAVISIIPTLFFFFIFGALAIVIVPTLVIAGAFFLFVGRSRKGLQLQRYKALNDQRKADPSTFYVCFQPTTAGIGFGRVVASSEVVYKPLENTPTAVFTPSRRVVGKRKPA